MSSIDSWTTLRVDRIDGSNLCGLADGHLRPGFDDDPAAPGTFASRIRCAFSEGAAPPAPQNLSKLSAAFSDQPGLQQ
jgi:hypothetical protein